VRPVRISRFPLAVVAVIAALTACSGPAPSNTASNPALAKAPPATYYLALGDSLSQGVQPNAAGVSVMTPDGYADQVYAALRPSRPGLKLVKLGCPGETTASMINGGICRYQGGSQLAAAVAFLQAHRGRVLLVTLDIGANDPEHCGGEPGLSQLAKCAVKDVPAAVGNLGTITTRLKAAAGPGVRIVGMTYYLPALAEWRSGLPGRVVAWTAEKLAATYNRLLTRAYATGRTLVNASLQYLGIAWSFAYGVLLFDDKVTAIAIAGMLLIAGAGLSATLLRSRNPRMAEIGDSPNTV